MEQRSQELHLGIESPALPARRFELQVAPSRTASSPTLTPRPLDCYLEARSDLRRGSGETRTPPSRRPSCRGREGR